MDRMNSFLAAFGQLSDAERQQLFAQFSPPQTSQLSSDPIGLEPAALASSPFSTALDHSSPALLSSPLNHTARYSSPTTRISTPATTPSVQQQVTAPLLELIPRTPGPRPATLRPAPRSAASVGNPTVTARPSIAHPNVTMQSEAVDVTATHTPAPQPKPGRKFSNLSDAIATMTPDQVNQAVQSSKRSLEEVQMPPAPVKKSRKNEPEFDGDIVIDKKEASKWDGDVSRHIRARLVAMLPTDFNSAVRVLYAVSGVKEGYLTLTKVCITATLFQFGLSFIHSCVTALAQYLTLLERAKVALQARKVSAAQSALAQKELLPGAEALINDLDGASCATDSVFLKFSAARDDWATIAMVSWDDKDGAQVATARPIFVQYVANIVTHRTAKLAESMSAQLIAANKLANVSQAAYVPSPLVQDRLPQILATCVVMVCLHLHVILIASV
ncbi:hypothetical protein BCR44DRAFT_212600 [Catenaria anguillulae PL171]|uniref:Uncharacterized protein n=1 Tax=Catenaria anguillulae PL171 TaxID=765915 RepID=A0A1Y2I407_9FUNG|nr:hypothetical protein BCR44DRAFT_212600 [Catenaria anguillulae PL171]